MPHSPSIQSFLKKYSFRPNDLLGQNFLINDDILEAIVEESQIGAEDQVLEIGPGIGNLTKLLSEKSKFVLAVEKDKRYLPILRDVLGSAFISDIKTSPSTAHVKVVFEDVLRFNFQELLSPGYKVVANIPYYITGKIIEMLVTAQNKPSRITLLIQKEVAERICADPGNLSILAISVQLFAKPRIVQIVSRNDFYPSPDVDSAVLILDILEKPLFEVDQKKFFRLLKATFSGKRKQIHNTLESNLGVDKESLKEILESSSIGYSTRPQDLSLNDWKELYLNFVQRGIL